MTPAASIQLHATCVAFDAGGVLLRGPSGAGKSDLALRLIDRGARLVADDRVDVVRRGSVLTARAPRALSGLLEIRGVGIARLAAAAAAADIALVVDLVARSQVERLPEPRTAGLLGVAVRCIAIDPFEASAVPKVTFALGLAALVDDLSAA